jgi:hypothetical protein
MIAEVMGVNGRKKGIQAVDEIGGERGSCRQGDSNFFPGILLGFSFVSSHKVLFVFKNGPAVLRTNKRI